MSIVLKNVTYTYMAGTSYELNALKNISLNINKGQFIGIIGRTGSGKSTLIQHMNGLLRPNMGKVLIDNVDINSNTKIAKKVAQKVGMVFQFPEYQIIGETVYEDIAFGPRNLKLSEAVVESRVRDAMQFTGLDFIKLAHKSPFCLSNGQLRRVAIAGAIALQPEYLILDEPTIGLDLKAREEIYIRIIDLYQTSKISVILISHNMDEIARLVNRLIILHNGIIIRDGTPTEVFSGCLNAFYKTGLELPLITQLLNKLQENGIAVNNTAYTIEYAVNEIIAALERK